MVNVRKALTYSVLIFVGVFFFVSRSSADTRSMVWTYEYGTEPKGGAEVEYYFTAKGGNSEGTSYQHQIELEYGITDHWDVGMYQMFGKEGADSLDYQGFKLKTRYRFGERGKYFIDPEVYVEYENRTQGEKDAVELKFILSKDIGKLIAAYNQIEEITSGRGGIGEHEYAAGLSYPLYGAFRIGVESTGSYTEREYAVGPTLAWAGPRFWANVGAVFGLNKHTPNTQVRFLLGIPF